MKLAYAVTAALLCSAAASPASAQAEPYLDDRSTPERVVASLYDALNAQDYARAWSYYAEDAHPVARYETFVAGYRDTVRVQLRTGQVTQDAAMSHVYSGVPVALNARQSDGSMASFSGCYLLVQTASGVQDPPFRGIRIIGGRLKKSSGPTGAIPPKSCDPSEIPRY